MYYHNMNPTVSAFPAACGGVSERHQNNIYSLRIEDSPQLAAESFNFPKSLSEILLLCKLRIFISIE